MPETLAYLNGNLIPAEQLSLPVYDSGFVQGVAVSEQMRTFRGQLFRLAAHLERLQRSLEIIGLAGKVDLAALASAAEDLAKHNHSLLAADDDLGLSLFITPGAYPTFAPPGSSGVTVGMHTYPLPFPLWAPLYRNGQALVVSDVRQIPPECWPAELKCRSRMHYYLADRQAAAKVPGARALLLDLEDRVIEASTANLVAYRKSEGLISPPREVILPGVSVAALQEVAAKLGMPFVHRTLFVEDLLQADEVFLTSTSPCIWPVVSINQQAVGNGQPGSMFETLLSAWSELVGVEIRSQAELVAARRAEST